jgi:pyruvate formate lyase activating enzyme
MTIPITIIKIFVFLFITTNFTIFSIKCRIPTMSKNILCKTCARNCEIAEGTVGFCGVRSCKQGKLDLMAFSNLTFLKKQKNKLLVGSFGNNMRISFDPNWDTSLFPFLKSKEVGREKANELLKDIGYKYTPEELVEYAKSKKCDTICFQFNEPLVYLEYILEVCKFDIQVHFVTTGYFSDESLKKILDYVDEVHILFFSTFDKFYMKHCRAQLSVVKENILKIFQSGMKLKILYPLIEGENDSVENILSFGNFFKKISLDIPIEFLKFIPSFRMLDKHVTSEEKLMNACDITRDIGLKNVTYAK